MFGAKILTKIYAKVSQTLCTAVSKMSSKTMVTILITLVYYFISYSFSNYELILKVYEG